jgi:hypothetical protein
MNSKIKLVIIIFLFDLILSSVFLKNTTFWHNENWEKYWWRIPSKIYHHDLLPNIDQIEKWGGILENKIITNSIGFRDKEIRKVNKVNKEKKRILLIGDSFIEGAGVNYQDSFAGLLDKHLGNQFEILNSAVGSYSPSIYYKKINFYLGQGYKFDQALIFLDLSDIYDELFIKFNEDGEILTFSEKKKQNIFKTSFYQLGYFLRENTVIFRFFYTVSDKIEVAKNYIKLKIKASKNFNKTFFETNRDDVMFYRMTHIDRGYWTFNEKTFKKVEDGLIQSEIYLKKLFNLLNKNNIPSTLIVYPWPTQILYGDNFHQNYWLKFSQENKINFLNLYKVFESNNNRRFILENFIYGDIHWNKNGTELIFKEVIKNIDF